MVFEKVRNWIYDEIKCGRFSEGSRLPTRHELMRRYNVSRFTVDKAITHLVKAGVLYSVQGAGTYVKGPQHEKLPRLVWVGHEDYGSKPMFLKNWSDLTRDLAGLAEFMIVDAKDVEKRMTEILHGPSWIIWDKPALDLK